MWIVNILDSFECFFDLLCTICFNFTFVIGVLLIIGVVGGLIGDFFKFLWSKIHRK